MSRPDAAPSGETRRSGWRRKAGREFRIFLAAGKSLRGAGTWCVIAAFAVGIAVGGRGVRSWLHTRELQKAPCLVQLAAGENSSDAIRTALAAELTQDSRVLACGEFAQTEGVVQIGNESLELEIRTQTPELLEGEWLAGGVYEETSSMPYAVLNEAAKRKLESGQEDLWENWSPGGEITLAQGEEETVQARLTGILRDGRSAPVLYVNQSPFADGGDETGLLARLNHAKDLDWLTETAERYGYTAEEEEAETAFDFDSESDENSGEDSDGEEEAEEDGSDTGTDLLLGGFLFLASLVLFAFREQAIREREADVWENLCALGVDAGSCRAFSFGRAVWVISAGLLIAVFCRGF